MNKKILFILWTLIWAVATSHASTTITAQVMRTQSGSGSTLISSGFPFPPGLVTETMITKGTIRVIVNGTEVAANVSALRGRHNDGSLRSALIQFTMSSMTQGDILSANVIIDSEERSLNDPVYQRPTLAIVQNNNVILPTDPNYITSTLVTFQRLLPVGTGSVPEENLYTNLANNRFDALFTQNEGTASYEDARAMLSLWARSGDKKYFNYSVQYILNWIKYNTPGNAASPDCKADEYVNPDGRTPTSNSTCGLPAEWNASRFFSYASMYLLTGYRDFWSVVAYNAQYQQRGLTDQEKATTNVIARGAFDTPRYNYAERYGALIPAIMIDATMPIGGQWFSARTMNWASQLGWTLNAIKNTEWDLQWIPFENGSGVIPSYNTTISQGGVSGIFKGVYLTRDLPRSVDGTAMPSVGYIQVKTVTGGNFSSGSLSGISAIATGPNESDYRQGLVGCRSDSSVAVNMSPQTVIPSFQLTFTTNFLIDYYLNVDADSRIPLMVKKNLDIVLQQIRPMASGDTYYGVSGESWGNPIYGKPYSLRNPVSAGDAAPYDLPEYTRIIAFVLKTVGEDTVNGASYSTWYNRCINTANVSPVGVLTWSWKNFGQFYGWGMDAPWMMAQATLNGFASMRTPTNYTKIPGDDPDLQRTRSPQIRSITLP